MRRRLAALLLLALLVPGTASGQVYRWVDEEGTLHFTSGLDRVPPRYRETAELVPSSPSAEPETPDPVAAVSRITFTPGSPIFVNARINGAGPIILILDTGADRTLVAPAALRALGIATEGAGRAELTSVTGTRQVEVVWVTSVEVERARVGPLQVIAHDAELGQAHGLLGRDFLERFRVTIDSQSGVVTLTPP